MNEPATVLLTSQLLATAAMVGLVWFVRVVHHPLFAAVGSGGFAQYEQLHQRRTSLAVGPSMAATNWARTVGRSSAGSWWR